MNPLNIKNTLFSIAGGSLLLTSVAISSEAELKEVKVQSSQDPAIKLITNEVLAPIIAQNNRTNNFSRVLRASKTYNLVEVLESATEEQRMFHITSTSSLTLLKKTKGKSVVKNQGKTIVAHEIKYLTPSNKILIKQGNDWVTIQDHKFLSLLPKATKVNKVTLNKT